MTNPRKTTIRRRSLPDSEPDYDTLRDRQVALRQEFSDLLRQRLGSRGRDPKEILALQHRSDAVVTELRDIEAKLARWFARRRRGSDEWDQP